MDNNETNPYKGTKYEQLWESNPWRQNNYGQLGLWDKIGNWLGFRTGEDEYETERQTNYDQWNAELEAKIQSDFMNSLSGQVQEAREAGQNPDLMSLSPGGSTDFNAPNPYESDFGNKNREAATNFATGCIQAIQLAFGMYSGIQQIDSQILANNGDIFENAWKTTIAGIGEEEDIPIVYSRKKFQKQYENNVRLLQKSGFGKLAGLKLKGDTVETGTRVLQAEILAPIIEANKELISETKERLLGKDFNEAQMGVIETRVKQKMFKKYFDLYEDAERNGNEGLMSAAAMMILSLSSNNATALGINIGLSGLKDILSGRKKDSKIFNSPRRRND